MRGAPQSGLARLIFRISRRISGGTLGLPARRRDFQRQKEQKPARCHRTTVSRSTIVRASRIRGAIRYRQTKIRRSKLLKTGRQHIQLMAQSEYLCLERSLRPIQPEEHPPIRLSRSRIEHSSPDSDLHAKQTGFATATTDLDLFGVHPDVGLVRTDCSDVVMLSNGRRVVAVSEHTIAYDDRLTFYRKPARERGPSVAIWVFRDRHSEQ
jgi:hypothetical protein